MCSDSRVSTTADSLPNDLESLRALAAQVIAERDAAIAEREAAIKERDAERAEKAKLATERDRLQGLYEHVHHLLRKANDHRFGARSERLDRLPADQPGSIGSHPRACPGASLPSTKSPQHFVP